MNIPLIIVLLILASLSFAIWQNIKKKKEDGNVDEAAMESEDSLFTEKPGTDLILENVRAGGILTLIGMGDNYEDVDAIVRARHIYRSEEDYWYELECDCGGKSMWLEVPNEISGELNLSTAKLSLPELGLSLSRLRLMEEDGEGEIEFKKSEFYYDDSGESEYFENGKSAGGRRFYFWYFLSSDEKVFISVNHWGRGQCDAFYGRVIQESDINIFALTAG